MPKTKNEKYYRVASNHQERQRNWDLMKPTSWGQWNGNHRRLQNTESPCISTCTTATNLSSLGEFQSNSTMSSQRKMKDNNLRMVVHEIEPLQKKEAEEKLEEPCVPPKTNFLRIRSQLFATLAVSWVSLIIGYSTAYTSPAQASLELDFGFTSLEISWISSFMPLGALAGGLGGGTLIENFGRKWTILLTNILFLISWLTISFAQTYMYLYVGRIITGIAVGIGSLSMPVYTAETIQPEVRGSLGLFPTALGNVGILICFLSGTFFQWRALGVVGGILSIPFLIMVWFIPETPKFLMSKGQDEKARKALQWLRAADADVDKEFLEMQKIQKDSDDNHESILVLFSRNNLKLLSIVLGLMLFQQFSGINAVIFYTTKIFKESGSELKDSVCTTIVGVVNFVSTFIASLLIDKLGRKVLLYISSSSMILSLGVLGAYFYMKNVTSIDVHPLSWLPLISFMIYVLGFSLGFGPIPWLMMGEILPARIRGPAASISTAFNWTCTFIVTKTFLLIMDSIGAHYTFWMYGIIVTGALVFSIAIVPETRGQSLADIERKLAGVRTRRISSIANLKPMPSTC
uniref:Putative sugar transporter n=2 Tax=Phaedon cochleariae TaxID=80249 RepID=W4VS80_PHACE